MADLKNPRLMYLKGAMFVIIGLIASAVILLETQSWKIALLLVLAIWAFARAYYFAFYVIERYIDPTYKFAGLASFVAYLVKRPSTADRSPTEPGAEGEDHL